MQPAFVSQEVLAALLTGTVVGFSLAAAYFILINKPVSKPVAESKPEESTSGDRKRTLSGQSEEDSSEEEDEDPGSEPHKMVMVVNESLKMGKGKIAAQCCHGCLGAYKRASEKAIAVWRSQGQAKIAVKAQDETELAKVRLVHITLKSALLTKLLSCIRWQSFQEQQSSPFTSWRMPGGRRSPLDPSPSALSAQLLHRRLIK